MSAHAASNSTAMMASDFDEFPITPSPVVLMQACPCIRRKQNAPDFYSTSLRHEFLHAPAIADFGGIDVAVGIDRDIVQAAEFAGHAAGAPEAADQLAVLAQKNV